MKTRTATCLVVSSLMVLSLRADPIGVQTEARGTLWYPNQGPDSVGNETVVSFVNGSGVLPGDSHATSAVNETISGTDASAGPDRIGTSGTSTVSVSVDASLGHLAASGAVSAESHSNGGSPAFFAHGAAAVNPLSLKTARFNDITTVYNAAYALGEAIPVELTLFLDWHGGFDLGTTGFNFAQSGATALLSVDWVGNVSAYDLKRSDSPAWAWSYSTPQTISFSVANGSSFGWWSSLTIFTGVSLGGVYEDFADYSHFPPVSASAFSNATIDITPTSGYAGTTFTSETGHAYVADTAPGVPDATSTLALLGLGLGGLGCASRRLQRTRAA